MSQINNDEFEREDEIEEEVTKKKKGKSFYIALGICLVAIGAATFTTYKNTVKIDTNDDNMDYVQQESYQKQSKPSKGNDENYKVYQEDFSQDQEDNASKANVDKVKAKEDIEVKAQKAGLIVFPAGQNIQKEYSGDNPVYSKTFSDWRIHNGTDFAAEKGSKVVAITDGVVKNVFEDPLLGMTIEIEHDGGFTAFYSGLGNTTLVNKDDKVESGQDIGSINDIPGEIADEPHLHLSIKRDVKTINPVELLGQP